MISEKIKCLQSHYGTPNTPNAGVFEFVIRENIAYLASDDSRDSAMALLKVEIGFAPESILSADPSVLHSIASHGILVENTISKLRRIAEIAMEDWDGDVERILRLPKDAAVRALKRFPSIGQPGAEKILLLAGGVPVLALDSNGLRVLLQLGYGEGTGKYHSTYRSAQTAASKELPADPESHIKAHMLLRQHGTLNCKTDTPQGGICPVNATSSYARSMRIDTLPEPPRKGPESVRQLT